MLLCAMLLCACATGKAPEPAGASAENIIGVEFPVPEGFIEQALEGYASFYSAPDGSSINVNIQDKDPAFESVSARALIQALTEAFRSAYDIEVEIQENAFDRVTIDGYPAYILDISYEVQGTALHQQIVGIDADETYTVTYTDTTESWQYAFGESCASIRFVVE